MSTRNLQKPSIKISSFRQPKPVYAKGFGEASGLNLVVNTSVDDYYYQVFSSSGVFTMIFDPIEYPDLALGNARFDFVDSKTENFIRLKISVNEADPEVKNYEVDKVS